MHTRSFPAKAGNDGYAGTFHASKRKKMKEQFQIDKAENLIKYLNSNGREDIDFDYQLETNAGFVFNLENGKVVFLPNDFQSKGLLIENKEIFKEMIENDYLPIEKEFKNLFETEIQQIQNINNEINNYQIHLNKTLKFDFQELNKEAAHFYLKKVVGRTIKQLTTDKDIVGLIAIFGELIRKEVNGKWFTFKRYGKYNPYYEPNIVTEKKKVIMISNKIMGNIKWKVATLESIFNKMTFEGINGGIDFDKYCFQGNCKILE